MAETSNTESLQSLLEAFNHFWSSSSIGPMHIIIEDYNLTDEHITMCRDAVLTAMASNDLADSESRHPDEFKADLLLLDLLLLIPENVRDFQGWLIHE